MLYYSQSIQGSEPTVIDELHLKSGQIYKYIESLNVPISPVIAVYTIKWEIQW